MKKILFSLLVLISTSSFAMDFNYFLDHCPTQLKVVKGIDQRIERLPEPDPASDVVMAAVRGFIVDADTCAFLDTDFEKIKVIMTRLKIK